MNARAWFVLLALAGLAPSAYADKAKAEQYFHAGAEAFKKQSFRLPPSKFEFAYKELALPEIRFPAAQAYRRQYFIDPKPAYVKRAVELYHVYLDNVKHGGRVADASDGLAEMQRELDKLTAQGTKIEGEHHPRPDRNQRDHARRQEDDRADRDLGAARRVDHGATATLDGKPAELFTPLDVPPGDHTVEIAAPGYFPQSIKRHVVEGSTELVEATLEPKPAKLVVHAENGADIAIDGKPVPRPPSCRPGITSS